MIFVTVGTHHQPFQRLLDALEALPLDEVIVQFGHGSPPPGVKRATPFMSFPEMLESFDAADAVITHAGVGSILCARRAGHVPIVVPRRRRHGEHVDDHQAELARALAERRAVVCVWDVERLAGALDSLHARKTAPGDANGRLPRAVREAVL